MSLGAMQDFPLRIMRILDHAEREHGGREIVSARADGTVHRTDWKRVALDARRLAQALVRMGVSLSANDAWRPRPSAYRKNG